MGFKWSDFSFEISPDVTENKILSLTPIFFRSALIWRFLPREKYFCSSLNSSFIHAVLTQRQRSFFWVTLMEVWTANGRRRVLFIYIVLHWNCLFLPVGREVVELYKMSKRQRPVWMRGIPFHFIHSPPSLVGWKIYRKPFNQFFSELVASSSSFHICILVLFCCCCLPPLFSVALFPGGEILTACGTHQERI